jgi:hypothetical protein
MTSPLDKLILDNVAACITRIAVSHEMALDRVKKIIEKDGFPSPSDGINVYLSDEHNSIFNLPLMVAFWAGEKQYAVLNSPEDNLGDSDWMASNSMVFDLSEDQFLGSVAEVLNKLRIKIDQESKKAGQQIDLIPAVRGQFEMKSHCQTINATEQNRECLNTLYRALVAAFEELLPEAFADDWSSQQSRYWVSVAFIPSSRPA